MKTPITVKKKQNMNFDVKEADLDDISVGDEVVIKARGIVHSVSAPYEYETSLTDVSKRKVKKEPYGDIRVKVEEYEIAGENDNEFTKLAKTEELDT